MAKRKSGRGICVSSFGFGAFCCACVIRFAVFLMRPLCFMLSFLIRLPAYHNVRTEPQSDIGHNRGKKNILRDGLKEPERLPAEPVPQFQIYIDLLHAFCPSLLIVFFPELNETRTFPISRQTNCGNVI